MKRERLWGTLRQVWLRARPFLVSALAVVLIALQQIYYLDDPATVVLNIILLGLNLLLFVPLVRNAGKAAAYSGDTVDRVLQWVGLVFVSLVQYFLLRGSFTTFGFSTVLQQYVRTVDGGDSDGIPPAWRIGLCPAAAVFAPGTDNCSAPLSQWTGRA